VTPGGAARRTPARLLLLVVGSIFLGEVFVMAGLVLLPPLLPLAGAVLDAVLVTIVVFPALYAFMLAPMLRDAAALRRASEELKVQVEERTVELAESNKRLTHSVEELERSNREVTLLAEMVDLFQACRSTEEAYAVLARSAEQLFPESTGVLYAIKASRNLAEPVVSWGGAPDSARPFRPEECWGLRRGRPHLATPALVCSHLGEAGPSGEICLPIVAQDETLGVLLLRGGASGEALGGSLRLASAAAEHISLALGNLRLRETLRAQAIRDPLTGLFNRRYLEETQEREIKRAARRRSTVGVVMMDIDHFKRFNDTHGHEAGDVLLRELGAFVLGHVRAEDVACRYGGEEFALILPDASLEATLAQAEQLRQAVKRLNLQHRGEQLGAVSLSLGVSAYPRHGTTADSLLRAADQALYRAKKGGRDRVVAAV
jgi:diguanylate cyclase (GGDEF)-like protein